MKKLTQLAILFSVFWFSFANAIFIDDFLVNTEHRPGWQDECRVAVDDDGNFYITYTNIFYDFSDGSYDSAFGYITKFAPNGMKLLGPVLATPKSMFINYGGMLEVSPAGRIAVTWSLTPQIFEFPVHPYVLMLDTDLNVIKPLFRVDTVFDSLNGPYTNVVDLDMDDRGFFTIIMPQPKASPDTSFSRDLT